MDILSGAEGQLTNKLLVDISGTIKGFVKNVDVEMVEGKILIHMKLGQSAESYGLSRSESKLLKFESKITLVADEIVSVGKDCIVVSKGKLPPLEEIKKAKMYKAENDSLKEKLNQVNEELENSLRKLKVLKEDKAEMEFKLNKLLKIEEEFDDLRLKCAKQEGELEASRIFIGKLKGQESTKEPKERIFPKLEEIIDDEVLDKESEKEFDNVLNEDFTLFGEEEKTLSGPKEIGINQEKIESSDEVCNKTENMENKTLSPDNPFRKFSREFKKDGDYI